MNYTTRVVLESLRDENNATKRRRATSAIAFFTSILDPAIAAEKAQLKLCLHYRAALDGALANIVCATCMLNVYTF